MTAERLAAAERCIETLLPETRQCLLLYAYQGRTYQEIADLLQIPINTVKRNIHDGRLALRQRVGQQRAGFVRGGQAPTPAGALTPDLLDGLLAHLAPDREQALEVYQVLRRKLVRFFEWRGVGFPEDLADEVLNRAARRLAEGTEIQAIDASSIYGLAHQMAREVLLQFHRGRAPEDPVPAPDADLHLLCLEKCIGRLSVEQRDLILRYYGADDRISNRRRLARELRIRVNALRIRVHRVRRELADCCSQCLAAAARPAPGSPSPASAGEGDRG